jgi:hypothetical protein
LTRASPPARPRRLRLLALALLLLAGPGRAAEPVITWDKDLAFEWDRANYERILREVVLAGDAEVTAWLGLRPDRPIRVEVLTRARYEARFGSDAAWSQGAHYRDGAIHVNGGARLGGFFEGLIFHELTHAVLDHRGNAHVLPTWLTEGLAERLGYRRRGQTALATTQVGQLEDALEHGLLLPLPRRGPLTRFGYLQSFAAVLYLEQKLGRDQLLRVVRRALELGSFEKALDLELRWTQRDIDDGFRSWVDHLQ